MTRTALNKMFAIDRPSYVGHQNDRITVSGFIARRENEKRPIPNVREPCAGGPYGFRVLYLPRDIIHAAQEDGLRIVQTYAQEQESVEAEEAHVIAAAHELAKAELPQSMHHQRLLTEKEIVRGSEPVPLDIGIYFLVKGGKVVYVGQSINVPARIASHRNDPSKRFDRWTYIKCPRRSLDVLETMYILSLKPKYNRSSQRNGMVIPLSYDKLLSLVLPE